MFQDTFSSLRAKRGNPVLLGKRELKGVLHRFISRLFLFPVAVGWPSEPPRLIRQDSPRRSPPSMVAPSAAPPFVGLTLLVRPSQKACATARLFENRSLRFESCRPSFYLLRLKKKSFLLFSENSFGTFAFSISTKSDEADPPSCSRLLPHIYIPNVHPGDFLNTFTF